MFLILISSLITVVQVGRCFQNEFPLAEESFSIKSAISIGGKFDRVSHLTEWYSLEQKRARLKYDFWDGETKTRDFFYDESSFWGLFYSASSDACAPASLKEFQADLFLDSLVRLLAAYDEQSNNAHSLVLGPSKLLFLLDENRHLLATSNETPELTVRNHPAVGYKLELAELGPVSLLAYYEKSSVERNEGVGRSIPLRLVVRFPASEEPPLTIEFFQHKVIGASQVHAEITGSSQLQSVGDDLTLKDLFGYPTSINCSSLLPEQAKVDFLRFYKPGNVRFSTNIRAEDGTFEWSLFLAFDGLTKTLRIDSQVSDHKFEPFVTVGDLTLNRKYTMTIPRDNSSEASCAVGQLLLSSKQLKSAELKLSEFLFGGSHFAYMGRAKVDGVLCDLYEAHTNSPPDWYSQPMPIKTPDGRMELKGRRLSSAVDETNYNTLVYVANSEDPLAAIRVVRLEVYDLKVPFSSNYRLLLRADFSNFVWNLSESPKGEPVSELFSVSQTCSLIRRDDRHVKVSMILEEEVEKKTKPESRKDFSWLEKSTIDRNKALVSAIRETLAIQSTMIYELRSSFVKAPSGGVYKVTSGFESRHSILLDFRVAQHPQSVHQVSSLEAKVSLKAKLPGGQLRCLNALSLAHCLALVGPALDPNRAHYIYYLESGRKCFFDPQISTKTPNPARDIQRSSLFELVQLPSEAEMYLVESRLDFEADLANHWLRDDHSRRMENRLLLLQKLTPEEPIRSIDQNSMKVRIRRIKLQNNNYLGGREVQTGKDSERLKLVEGLRLPEAFREEVAFAVQKVERNSSTLKGRPKGTRMMSLALCEAACLEEPNCRAFSFCHQLADSTCLISDFPLDYEPVQRSLRSINLSSVPRGARVALNFSSSGRQLELIRDRSCELHSKLYAGLFKKVHTISLTLAGMRVLPVESLEECAKLCFEESLVSLAEVEEANEEFSRMLNQFPQQKKAQREFKRRMSLIMRHFCNHFLFLDGSQLDQEQLSLLMKETKASSPPGGYCLVTDETRDGNYTNSFLAQFYSFDFTSLYEKLFGLRMLESSMNFRLHEAYSKLSALNESVEKASKREEQYDFELMRDFLNAGNNIQLRVNVEPNICASLCIWQSSQLWPSCQSFDTVLQHNTWDQSVVSVCKLNSFSMDQLEDSASALVEVAKGGQQSWHYELRFGVLKDSARLRRKLEVEGLKKFVETFSHSSFSYLESSKLAVKTILFIVTIGLASGLLIGVQIARKVVGPPQSANPAEDLRGSRAGGSSARVQELIMTIRANHNEASQ